MLDFSRKVLLIDGEEMVYTDEDFATVDNDAEPIVIFGVEPDASEVPIVLKIVLWVCSFEYDENRAFTVDNDDTVTLAGGSVVVG